MPDFSQLADENRDKIEQAAEKGVDAAEQRTGHRAPSQVDDAVDRIDPTDGDGGPGEGAGADTGVSDAQEADGAVDPSDQAPGA